MRIFLPLLTLLLISGNSFAAIVKLAWDPSTSPKVGGYKVSYGTSSGRYTSTINVGNKLNYSLTGLKDGVKYYLAVKAYDSANTIESAYSKELVATAPATATVQPNVNNGTVAGGTTSGATGGKTVVSTGGKTVVATGGTTIDAKGGAPSTNGNGLVAAYDFEEGNGKKVVDASGQGNHGIIKGAFRIPNGRYGQALEFDGVNDWVSVKDNASLDLSNAMTLEAWVYPLSQTNGNGAVIVKMTSGGEVYALYSEEDADLPVSYINDGEYHGVAGSNRLPVKKWSHLVATYDGSYQRLFVNGVQVAKSAQKTVIQQSKGKLRIGGNNLGREYFHGYIDEVRIYNRALTINEVKSNMATAIRVSNPPNFVMGDKKLEPLVDYRPEGTAEAFQTTAEKSGILTNVRIYLDASSTAKELNVGIYKNKKSGHPGTLIAQGKLNKLKAGAWNTIPVSATSVTGGRPYWIAILGSQGRIAFLDQVGSSTGLMETSASKTLAKLPKKWKGAATQTKAAMSLYGRGY